MAKAKSKLFEFISLDVIMYAGSNMKNPDNKTIVIDEFDLTNYKKLIEGNPCHIATVIKSGGVLKKQGYKFWKEVYYHGLANSPYQSEYLDLLNLADMHIDSEGNYVTLDGRLEELSKRYNVPIPQLNSYPIICELKAKGYK